MYGIAFDNMTLHKGIALGLVNELKINSLIYFSMILYFLDVIFSYKEIQMKYLFNNNQPV